MMRSTLSLQVLMMVVMVLAATTTHAFVPTPRTTKHNGMIVLTNMASSNDDETFQLEIDMPPSGSSLKAQLQFESVLDGKSEAIEVRYQLPFGLNVEPKNNLAVCTKDGKQEQVGDVLRYCSQWTLGLPQGDGLVTTAAAFSGGVSWQCSLFNVIKAQSWDEVVEALTSNVESRTDEVVLIFERPLKED